MSPCVHNDMIGLSNRYLKSDDNTVTFDQKLVDKIVQELVDEITSKHHYRPYTLKEFLDTRYGGARKRYHRAIMEILLHGYDPIKHSRILAFIKNEKYWEKKPPRMILGRDPKFNLTYGRFVLPLEKILSKIDGFCLGKDFFQCGEFMEKYSDHIPLMNDFSKFESTQQEECIGAQDFDGEKLPGIELNFWERMSDCMTEEEFAEILTIFDIKMVKDGSTPTGVRFVFIGLRGSGDVDTTFGNSLLNYVACKYFLIVNKIKHKFMVKGDDSLIAIEPELFLTKPEFINTFKHFGFDSKLTWGTCMQEAEFCSAKFVQYSPGKWMLCPDLRKLINSVGYLINKDFYHCIGHYYYSLGFMYKCVFPGLPFFRELSTFLMGITNNPKIRVDIDLLKHLNPHYVEIMKLRPAAPVVNEITFYTSVLLAFGLQRVELEVVYSYFRNTTVDVTGHDKRFNKKGSAVVFPHESTLHTIQREMTEATLACKRRAAGRLEALRRLRSERFYQYR